MRVLLVEDERGLVGALTVALSREGYAVDCAVTKAEAEQKLAVTAYDIALLDVNLPDGDGFEIAAAIRAAERPSPSGAGPRILMLTARGQLRDRVRGLDLGADDYLVKPFALIELTARMRALLRRELAPSSSVLVNGPIRLDVARQLATRDNRDLSLTLKEYGVLRYLMGRAGYVVSAEELLEHVWDENADPFTQTVRVTVGTLRRKLSASSETAALETVVGRGYRLRDFRTDLVLGALTTEPRP